MSGSELGCAFNAKFLHFDALSSLSAASAWIGTPVPRMAKVTTVKSSFMRFPTPEITSSFRVRSVATIAARYGRFDRNPGSRRPPRPLSSSDARLVAIPVAFEVIANIGQNAEIVASDRYC
jgi:hypothetical protein